MENEIQKLIDESKAQREEISSLKKIIQDAFFLQVAPEWISRKMLMEFFGYQDTQIAELLKNEHLVISQIGAKKFIERASFNKLLAHNIKSKSK